MDEISEEMGLDLQTESLLVRAEQLARLETDKLVDKVKKKKKKKHEISNRSAARFHFSLLTKPSFPTSIRLLMCCLVCSVFVCVANVAVSAVAQYSLGNYTILPRIRRERSFHELPSMKEVSHFGGRQFFSTAKSSISYIRVRTRARLRLLESTVSHWTWLGHYSNTIEHWFLTSVPRAF